MTGFVYLHAKRHPLQTPKNMGREPRRRNPSNPSGAGRQWWVLAWSGSSRRVLVVYLRTILITTYVDSPVCVHPDLHSLPLTCSSLFSPDFPLILRFFLRLSFLLILSSVLPLVVTGGIWWSGAIVERRRAVPAIFHAADLTGGRPACRAPAFVAVGGGWRPGSCWASSLVSSSLTD